MMQPMRTLLAASGIAICFVVSTFGQAPPYRLVPGWGTLPNGATWGETPGMAIDASGKLYAFHRSEPPIVELDASGKILKMWGEKLFAWPHGLRVDRFGNLWITDGQARDGIGQQVFKYSTDGKLLMTLGTKGVRGEGPDTFGGPCDVAVAANGDIFVADGHVNSRIVKFDKDGKFLMQWGEKSTSPNDTKPGTFNAVHGVQVDPMTRKVYVTDRENHRFQVFDENGKYLDQFSTGEPSTPQVLYLAADRNLWTADNDTSKIVKYDIEGHYLYSWGSKGEWPGALWNVHGMSVDSDGNLYLAEVNNGRLEKFRPRKGANPALLVGQPLRAAQ